MNKMAKSTYSKTKKPAMSSEDKDQLIEKNNESVEAFLKERVKEVLESIELKNQGTEFIWNSPVFEAKYSNPASGVTYNTENSLILSLLSKNENYEFPFYLTAKQGYEVGLSNKGEKSNFIVHRFGMNFGAIKEKNEVTGEYDFKRDEKGEIQYIHKRAAKLTSVFNLSQFTGEIPEKFKKIIDSVSAKIPTAEEVNTVLQATLETMPTKLNRAISHDGSHNYYLPYQDEVFLAPQKLFKSNFHELYVLLHEVSHSYGHKNRKNRESLEKYSLDEKYRSYEELVANLSAQAVIKHFNFKIDDEAKKHMEEIFIESHNAYDVSWAVKALKHDPMSLFKAAADADRTANEIIFKIENNLKLKYEQNSELEISDFIKSRLTSKLDEDETKVDNKKNKRTAKP